MDWILGCFIVLLFIGYKLEKLFEYFIDWRSDWEDVNHVEETKEARKKIDMSV